MTRLICPVPCLKPCSDDSNCLRNLKAKGEEQAGKIRSNKKWDVVCDTHTRKNKNKCVVKWCKILKFDIISIIIVVNFFFGLKLPLEFKL